MKTLAPVIVVLFLAQAGYAEVKTNSLCRITSGTMHASGVHIGNGLILSCAHLSEQSKSKRAILSFPSNSHYRAELIATDTAADLGLYDAGSKLDEPHEQLSLSEMTVGQRVESGAQLEVDQAWRQGEIVELVEVAGVEMVLKTRSIYPGESGAPVFDTEGEIAGVAVAGDTVKKMTLMCNTRRVRRFLLPWNARLAKFQTMAQNGYSYCGPSGCYEAPVRIQNGPIQMSIPQGTQANIGAGTVTKPVPNNQGNAPLPVPVQKPLTPLQDPTPSQPDCMEELKKLEAKVEQNAKGITQNSRNIEDLSNKVNGAVNDVDQKVNDLDQKVNDLDQKVEAQKGGDPDLERRIADLEARPIIDVTILEAKIQELSNKIDQNQNQNQEPQQPSRAWMYYTSRSVPGVKEIDDLVNELRNQGMPIAITYLTAREAEVTGVPRLFIMHENRQVVGISNLRTYISSLVPR